MMQIEDFCKFLVKKSLITQELADEALFLENRTDLDVFNFFLSRGIRSIDLYKFFAIFQGLLFVDLYKDRCDITLLDSSERHSYIKYSAVPWRIVNKKIVIVTSYISSELEQWALKKYKKDNYSFAVTSPYDIQHSVFCFFREEDDLEARNKLLNSNSDYSAYNLFSKINYSFICFFILILSSFIFYFPDISLILISVFINTIYLINILFKFIIITFFKKILVKEKDIPYKKDKDLPIYTILVPMYKEEVLVASMVNAIKNLDYPKHKLDIKFIIEEDDLITYNTINKLGCERIFNIIKVPYSIPRTKPKACNYALRFAKGDFTTIYDIDDIPEPMQLRKAIHTFETSEENLACVQAKLKYYNSDYNILTKLFAMEYSILFEFILPVFELFKIPILLGGSSNHFKTEILNKLNAWDSYNVAEDADLGLRIFREGFKTKMIDSFTEEEAPVKLNCWIKQRVRWIKGHIQTYFVHMRKPYTLYKEVGFINFISIQIFLGATVFTYIVGSLIWCLSFFFFMVFLDNSIMSSYEISSYIDLSIYIFMLVIVLQFFISLLVVIKNKWWNMFYLLLIFPFYWILHSIAAFFAVIELYKKPYHWNKTSHNMVKET